MRPTKFLYCATWWPTPLNRDEMEDRAAVEPDVVQQHLYPTVEEAVADMVEKDLYPFIIERLAYVGEEGP